MTISIAVVGAHLRGQPLHHQLSDRGAVLVVTTATAPIYRMYALPTDPPKPGLVRVDGGGGAIAVEVWALADAAFGTFVDGVPAPLVIGRLALADGSDVAGFLCEPIATVGARDITEHGGWQGYLSRASG